jgi:hypothetical protein
MSIEQNLVTLERARQQWNAGNLEGYLQLYAPDVILHRNSSVEPVKRREMVTNSHSNAGRQP